MNATRHAVRLGLSRGWTEFLLSLRSPQDQGFYLFVGILTLGYLYLRRATPVDGTDLLFPSVAMPSILGGLVAFGAIIGPASALAIEREDGTVLRARTLPHGLTGYVTGQLLLHSISLVPLLTVLLVPGVLLFDNLWAGGGTGWLTALWVLALGMLATLPLGVIIGSLVRGPRQIGTWGMLPIIAVTAISGIVAPMQGLWNWVQTIAQVFPVYWLGLGMRSAFLPDAAAAAEIGGSWRTLETVLVLAAWAIVGALVVPGVLRRMSQRQSGAAVQQARETAAQWVR